jgi:4-amino-4-deoxy-L-arabinose transferase-like glycosyltransferase
LGRPAATQQIAEQETAAASQSAPIPIPRRRRGIAAGVAGALLAFLALTTVQALGITPYLPPDELYHVGYAVVVRDGHLPTLTTPVPADEVPLRPDDGRSRRIYTANHPPLFYLPESVVLRIGSPAVALLAARMLSVGFGAAGVLMVAWLALILAPSRPRVAVAAAWFVALLPAVPDYSAFVYNDALGFLTSTATLVAGALALRRGPTGWRLAALAAAAAAAALTRAPGLALVGVAGAVAAVAVWLHSQRPPHWRLLAAAGAGALVGGTSLASSIWFYLRNRVLYGELTGSHYNLALFGFPSQNHPARLVSSPKYVLKLFDGLWVWTRFATRQIPVERTLVLIPRFIALAVLAGLALAAVRRLLDLRVRPAGAAAQARPAPEAPATQQGPAAPRARLAGPASWLLTLGWLVVAFLMVAWYDGNGGHTHARYLLPAVGVIAIIAAVGLDALPGARRGLTILAVSITLLALTGFAWSRFVAAVANDDSAPVSTPAAVADLLYRHGVAHPRLLLAGALLTLLAGLGLQQGGLWLLAAHQPRDQRAFPPADPQPEPRPGLG